MSSKYRRIAATADPKLKAGRSRRRAAEALLDAMGEDQFDLNLAAIDHLNAPPEVVLDCAARLAASQRQLTRKFP